MMKREEAGSHGEDGRYESGLLQIENNRRSVDINAHKKAQGDEGHDGSRIENGRQSPGLKGKSSSSRLPNLVDPKNYRMQPRDLFGFYSGEGGKTSTVALPAESPRAMASLMLGKAYTPKKLDPLPQVAT